MKKRPNSYDEQVKDMLTSKTIRIFCGCVASMFALAIIGSCLMILLAPALADAILRSMGLQ